MLRELWNAAFADGPAVGVVRILMASLYAIALADALGGAGTAGGQLMALIFALVLGCVVGARALARILFAPDRPLWHPEPGYSRERALALAACQFFGSCSFWASAMAGFVPYGGFLACLPLAASGLQRAVLRLARCNVSGP